MMNIRAGISRRLPAVGKKRRKIEHKNVTLQVEAPKDAEPANFTKAVMRAVESQHPGWTLSGYATPEGI